MNFVNFLNRLVSPNIWLGVERRGKSDTEGTNNIVFI